MYNRHNQSKKWVDAKYTSATEGSRRGNSWSKDGLRKFNSLSIMVNNQHTNDDTGMAVDEYLRAWCHSEANLQPLEKMGQTIATVTNEVVKEDDEVEAMGECDITQV
jgi:hypothetical protein